MKKNLRGEQASFSPFSVVTAFSDVDDFLRSGDSLKLDKRANVFFDPLSKESTNIFGIELSPKVKTKQPLVLEPKVTSEEVVAPEESPEPLKKSLHIAPVMRLVDESPEIFENNSLPPFKDASQQTQQHDIDSLTKESEQDKSRSGSLLYQAMVDHRQATKDERVRDGVVHCSSIPQFKKNAENRISMYKDLGLDFKTAEEKSSGFVQQSFFFSLPPDWPQKDPADMMENEVWALKERMKSLSESDKDFMKSVKEFKIDRHQMRSEKTTEWKEKYGEDFCTKPEWEEEKNNLLKAEREKYGEVINKWEERNGIGKPLEEKQNEVTESRQTKEPESDKKRGVAEVGKKFLDNLSDEQKKSLADAVGKLKSGAEATTSTSSLPDAPERSGGQVR